MAETNTKRGNWKRAAVVAAGAGCLAVALAIPGVFAAPSPEDAAQAPVAAQSEANEETAVATAEAADEETPAQVPEPGGEEATGNETGSADEPEQPSAGDADASDTSASEDEPASSDDASTSQDADSSAGAGDSSAADPSGSTTDAAASTEPAGTPADGQPSDADGTQDATSTEGVAAASSTHDAARASSTVDAQAAKTVTGTLQAGGNLPSGTYVLTENVTLAAALNIPTGEDVTIDLAGHTLDASQVAGSAVTCVGALTLTDSSTGGAVLGGETARNVSGGFANVAGGGSFTLAGGTISGFAATSGGAVYVAGSGSFTLDGGTIESCSATSGGAVYADGTFTLAGGLVQNCTATGNGGGFYAAASGSAMSGGTITGCTATGNGGAIYVGRSVSFTMTSGLIGDEGATCSLSSGTSYAFSSQGNSASSGGGIYAAPGTTLTITGGRFVGNKSTSTDASVGGGAIGAYQSHIAISDTAFERNFATNGGAVCSTGTVTLVISNSSFASNVSFVSDGVTPNKGNGGAVYTNGTSLEVYGSTFSNNASTRYGGSIITATNKSTLENCSFSYNTAYNAGGGAIMLDGGQDGRKVTNCTFDHNHTDRTGGAIHSRGGFTIKGGSFTANSCAGGGGAIAVIPLGEYTSTPNFTLEDVTIGGSAENANHSGSNAGAVYVGKGNCTITGSTNISFNYANGNGGGVYVNDGSLIMNNGAIESNYTENATSGNGAGVYVGGSGVSVTISGGSVSHNAANVTGARGGGIYVDNAADVTISGGRIEGNKASGHGGGLDIGGTSATVTIGSPDHATEHPRNIGCPVIRDNTSTTGGGALCIHGQGTTTIWCCDIANNVVTNPTSGASAIYQAGGTINLGAEGAEATSNPGVRINGNLHVTSTGVINIYDGVSIANGSLITAENTDNVHDYRNKDCAVTYLSDDTDKAQTASATATLGEAFELPSSVSFTKKGYYISGWVEKGGDGTVLPVGSEYTPTEKSVTFVAQWELVEKPGYLTITTVSDGTSGADAAADRKADRFVYAITGTTTYGDEVALQVETGANDSVTVKLQAGEYTVTPAGNWGWRYRGQTSTSVTIRSEQTATCKNDLRYATPTWQSIMTVEEAN